MAPVPIAAATPAPAAAARLRRTTVAARLIDQAPSIAETLDWDLFDALPDWLALPDAALQRLQCRIGALPYAAAMQWWIDGARLAAARAVLGEDFLQALLAEGSAAHGAVAWPDLPRIDRAAQVGPLLRAAGAGVLLASLPPGPAREAAGALLAPAGAAGLHAELAQTLIARAAALAAAVSEEAAT